MKRNLCIMLEDSCCFRIFLNLPIFLNLLSKTTQNENGAYASCSNNTTFWWKIDVVFSSFLVLLSKIFLARQLINKNGIYVLCSNQTIFGGRRCCFWVLFWGLLIFQKFSFFKMRRKYVGPFYLCCTAECIN